MSFLNRPRTSLTLVLSLPVMLPTASWGAGLPGSDGAPALHEFPGRGPGHRSGWALTVVPDLNGDLYPECAIGEPFSDPGGLDSGGVRLFDGQSGATLLDLAGDGALDNYGKAICWVPDVDGDGDADLLIGAPDGDITGFESGYARIVSTANGAGLLTVSGDLDHDRLGSSVASMGDADGDLRGDMVAGAFLADRPSGVDAGMVRAVSGSGGALLWQHDGLAAGDRFGIAMASIGDVDGDAVREIVVGADEGGLGPGYVRVFSGKTGALIVHLPGTVSGSGFGAAVGGFDATGDGIPEIAVGSPDSGAGGRVDVFSVAGGPALWFVDGSAGEAFGASLAGLGDVNQDGREELLVGAPRTVGSAGAGAAHLLSGLDGSSLDLYQGTSPGDRFGQAVASAGDADLDGRDDSMVGAPKSDTGAIDSGSAWVFAAPPSGNTQVYCTAKLNSLACLPAMGWSGTPSVSSSLPFELFADQVISNKPGLLFYGFGPFALPFQGGTLCVQPPVKRTPPTTSGGNPPPNDCSGRMSFDLNAWIAAGSDPALTSGTLTYAQFWTRDPGSPSGTGFTDAIEFVIVP